MKPLWLALIGIVIVIAIDFLWLGVIMKGFYAKQLGSMMGPAKIVPALLVWALIAVGVVLFALPLATSYGSAVFWGGLFGFALYGVYELTNYALVKDWPLAVVGVDMAWGVVLCALLTTLLYYVNSLSV